LGKSWQDLVIFLEILPYEYKQFEKGRECIDILDWLDERNKLGKLHDALNKIDRDDLVLFLEEEKSDDSSHATTVHHTATQKHVSSENADELKNRKNHAVQSVKKIIPWLVGLIIVILIVTFASDKFRTLIDDSEKAQVKQSPVSEPSSVDILIDDSEKPPEKQSPVSEPSSVDELKVSYAPFEYTINEHQPQFIKDAQTSLSVAFQNIYGGDIVSLNISPIGEQSFVRAVFSGYTEEFKSSTGVFNVQILSIDYSNKKVVVQVSRKS
jgi:hypothetical protein